MTDQKKWEDELFQGLRALAESAFPKRCANCGRVFETAEQFLSETKMVKLNSSGLKQSLDDGGKAIVEVYRNCLCGSTLMDFFGDRRDMSEAGVKRRKKFGKLLDSLVNAGLDINVARSELLKVLKGESSEVIKKMLLDKRKV